MAERPRIVVWTLGAREESAGLLDATSYSSSIREMDRPAARLSISLPSELESEVRRRVGARGVSSSVARAVAHELEREQLGAFLAEMEGELGPIAKKDLAAARRAWPKR